ncbi:MAG: hypothetical protein AAF928_15040 [Myxococcota bacterium]
MTAERLEATLALAHEVLDVLDTHDVQAVVIGALALAVHGYPRATRDLDLGVATSLSTLENVAQTLSQRGMTVALRRPDPQDPLGGVVDVEDETDDLVQLVNFDNPPAGGFPRLVVDALATAEPLEPGARLRVVDPYHLVMFKLYAGGPKSALDILALLARAPQLDRARLRDLAASYRLDRALQRVLSLADDGLT